MRRWCWLSIALFAACDPPATDVVDMPEDTRRIAEASQVPALIVNRSGLMARAKLMAKPQWYAMHVNDDGVTISLHATAKAHRYPRIKPASGKQLVRGHAAFVTQNEGIWSAAWIEKGTAYALEVECERLPDPRCDDDTFLMQIAGDLVRVTP